MAKRGGSTAWAFCRRYLAFQDSLKFTDVPILLDHCPGLVEVTASILMSSIFLIAPSVVGILGRV